ncbi:MAG: signal peptidase I [Spirochaetaceae bacterium]|nr:signal peptidase I [Spirochaetaceae bacterium]MBP5330178.1 signal peptidase I [Spirochaetaceae bacterium]
MLYSMRRNFLCILTGLLLGILLKLFVFDIKKIEGVSMEPCLKEGSYIMENKLAYGLVNPSGSSFLIKWSSPKKNDIVLYHYNNHTVVKRCVAVENEELEIYEDSGYSLVVGEKKIPLTEEQYHRIKYSESVPEGMILAVGDNYDESVDSRDYGFVSAENVTGKVLWK